MTSLPTDTAGLVATAAGFDGPHLEHVLSTHARAVAEAAHPELASARAAADTAACAADHALAAHDQSLTDYPAQLEHYGSLAYRSDPAGLLASSAREVADVTTQLENAHTRVHELLTEPALRCLTPERVDDEHQRWATGRGQATRQAQPDRPGGRGRTTTAGGPGPAGAPPMSSGRRHERAAAAATPEPGPGISR